MKASRTFTIVFFIAISVTLAQCRQLQLNPELQAAYTPRKSNDKYNGILGFVVGPILFVLSFVGIWFNQKRAAVNYRRLKLTEKLLEEQSQPKQYNLDSLNVNLNNQKRLMHQTGYSEILEPAKDEECQIFPVDAIVIQRKVEVKQMRCQSKRRSDEDQVQYKLEWVSQNIEQCEAESNSPLRWFIQNKQFYAPKARVNNYFLNESQMKMLECDTEINPTPETINALSQIAQSTGNQSQSIVFNNYIYFPAVNGDVESRGTLRVKFLYCRSTQLSIICTADSMTQTYEPFRIDLVDNDGEQDQPPCDDAQCCICCEKLAEVLQPMSEINLIMKGVFDSQQMIAISVKKNITETNLLRLLFFVLMVLGICIFFSPIVDLLGYLPIVGGFLKGTASIIVFIAAFLVSIPMFSITFGLAWLRYHPLIGGVACTFAVALLITFCSIQK